jgi:hypothetical protein
VAKGRRKRQSGNMKKRMKEKERRRKDERSKERKSVIKKVVKMGMSTVYEYNFCVTPGWYCICSDWSHTVSVGSCYVTCSLVTIKVMADGLVLAYNPYLLYYVHPTS